MLRLLVGFLALLFAAPCQAQYAQHAVLRIKSHGASGTVVQTAAGSTYILTCAHAFEGGNRHKPIRLDVPTVAPTVHVQRVQPTVVAVDYRLDLALIHISAGPLPYVCPIAPPSSLHSRRCLSVGYDDMELPPKMKMATIVSIQGKTIYTAEKPWHGRSGGGLIDEQGQLIGVVQGYEVNDQQRGMYVSHDAILSFIRTPPPQQYTPSPQPRYSAPPGCAPGGT
jgi:hypothetical protein